MKRTFTWGLMTSYLWPNVPVPFIVWLHRLVHMDSFHAAKVTFGMIGFLAIYLFYRAIVIFLRQEKIKILYIIAFFPSILFWSSTLSKEPLVRKPFTQHRLLTQIAETLGASSAAV